VFGDGGRRSRQCWATVGDGGVEVGVLYYVEGALPRLGAGGAHRNALVGGILDLDGRGSEAKLPKRPVQRNLGHRSPWANPPL
jgi:hypothetical protein